MIPQPAYSPELNPVEHIWDELREKYFHNRIFPSLEALIDVLCQGLCVKYPQYSTLKHGQIRESLKLVNFGKLIG